jgi:hypothetical protein
VFSTETTTHFSAACSRESTFGPVALHEEHRTA